jgi:hypothetical protein
MFRRWPFFQRLLSWTKPYAPVEHDSRAYERYDWNSLLADDPAHRSLMPGLMDGSSYSRRGRRWSGTSPPSPRVTGTRIRYDCPWTGTRREDGPDGERFVLKTADGEYRARIAIFAVGVAEPYSPATPGIELTAHYADTRPAETYAGRRVFIMGKQNSGFELASGLLPWARRIVLASPSPAKLSVNTKSLVGVRARYVQPIRGSRPRRRRHHPRRVDRRDRPVRRRRRPRRHGEALGGRRRAGDRGRRGDLGHGLRDARCWICRISVSRRSARAVCRPDAVTGRAPRCPGSSSRGRSAGLGPD